ncbi:MAG: glycosyltransferase [Abditibacteriota bacterium]|nr:glycosyltransferase [Abditibacteriota bacterium]
MKKICFLQYDLSGGGAERKVCTLANYFVSKGYTVDIGIFGEEVVAYDLDERVNLTFINRETMEFKNAFERYSYAFRCAMEEVFVVGPATILSNIYEDAENNSFVFFEKEKITLVKKAENHYNKKNNVILPLKRYIENRKDYIFISMMAEVYVKIMELWSGKKQWDLGKRYIVMDCNNPEYNAQGKLKEKRDWLYPYAAKCIMMTEGQKNWFNNNVQKITEIIPNPIRDDLPEPYFGERNKNIITFCRLSKQKNLPLLINAFKRVYEKHPDYTLSIYGQGKLREKLIEYIKSLNLQDVAHIYDFDPKIHERIKKSAMYVSSSNYEGFPNNTMEALGIGMPVICTDCDFGPGDLIENEVNGLLVPCEDEEALAEAINRFIEDPAFAAECGKRAVKVREDLAPDKIGDRWIEVIESINL